MCSKSKKNPEYFKKKEELSELRKLWLDVFIYRGIEKDLEQGKIIYKDDIKKQNLSDEDIKERVRKLRQFVCEHFLGKSNHKNCQRHRELIKHISTNDFIYLHPKHRKKRTQNVIEDRTIDLKPDSLYRFPLKVRTENWEFVPLVDYCYKKFGQGKRLIKIRGSKRAGKTTEVNALTQYIKDRNITKVVETNLDITNTAPIEKPGSFMRYFMNEIERQVDFGDEIKNKDYRIQRIEKDPLHGSYEYMEAILDKLSFTSEEDFLLITIDNIDKLFVYSDTTRIFFDFVKNIVRDLGRIRQLITYSSESYLRLDDMHFLSDLGETLTLYGLSLEDINRLMEVDNVYLSKQDIKILHNLIGGSPYLWQIAIPYLKESEFEVEDFKNRAFFNDKIQVFFSRICHTIEKNEQLLDSILELLEVGFLENLEIIVSYVLEGLGVIKKDSNHQDRWIISCEMYKAFLKKNLNFAEETDRNTETPQSVVNNTYNVTHNTTNNTYNTYKTTNNTTNNTYNVIVINNNESRIDNLLPENFKVYVKEGESVINHPKLGYVQRVLSTVNLYMGNDGGYIGVYSRDEEKRGICVGDGIYLIGQIRVPGSYNRRIFEPRGYKDIDISAVPKFKVLCNRFFPSEGGSWAGGDTGGWFGISP